MIVACDECGGEVLAVNAAKDDGTLYCISCFRQIVRESDFIGEDWENWQDENDEKGSIEDWAKYLNDYLEDAQKEYSVSRMWMKMARDEVARMVEAAKNAAA
jgi:hypothetical protein